MLFFRSMPWYFIGCCLYHCLGCFLGYCSVYYLSYCQFASHLVVLEAERLFSLVYFGSFPDFLAMELDMVLICI